MSCVLVVRASAVKRKWGKAANPAAISDEVGRSLAASRGTGAEKES
jgi:hypothetical protein